MLLSGIEPAQQVKTEIKEQISALPPGKRPALAVILVGSHPPSHAYVQMKKKACLEVGIAATIDQFPDSVTFSELLSHIDSLNAHPHIDGILLQLPLPLGINPQPLIEAIAPHKDVDGLHPENLGKLLAGTSGGFVPCTPLGIQVLLSFYGLHPAGKQVVILGRSQIVGKPLAALWMQNSPLGNATVTVAHSQTKHLKSLTHSAEILVAAIGVPRFVTKEMVKEGAIVIDVGMNRISDPSHPKGYRLVGDVDFDQVAPICSAITPVPKGVGPMTVAMLLSNTFNSFKKRVI